MSTYTTSEREQNVLTNVINILDRHLHPEKIILFGSRAKGNYNNHADFDFAVISTKPNTKKQREILEEIEEVSGLYSVDIVYLDDVEENFKQLVLRTGKILYERRN